MSTPRFNELIWLLPLNFLQTFAKNVFEHFSVTQTVRETEPEPRWITKLSKMLNFHFTGLFIPAVVETIFRYPDNLGFGNWIMIKNGLVIVFAVLSLVTGSFFSLKEILLSYMWEERYSDHHNVVLEYIYLNKGRIWWSFIQLN